MATIKEMKETIQKSMEVIKTNKYTCTPSEKEILIATYTKKADLEKQLETFKTVIQRNVERKAKAEAEKKAKEAESKAKEKPVAKLKKKATEKKAEPKKEPKKELYSESYDTNTMKLKKVTWTDNTLEMLENGKLLIGRYFNVTDLSSTFVYSIKEPELDKALKSAKTSPFVENVDLYGVVNKNQFVYIMQSVYTNSFNSMRKDVLQKAVEDGQIALYEWDKKEVEKPKATRKKKVTTK